MNWSYIAGFFDGEGCVHWRVDKQYIITISQVQVRNNVLTQIKDFLKESDINSNIFVKKPRPKEQPCSYLVIKGLQNTQRFLVRVYPFLIVKREKASQAIPHITERLTKRFRLAQTIDKAVDAYIDGLSSIEVYAKYGIAHSTLSKYLRHRGQTMRGKKEACVLSYKKHSNEIKAKIRKGAQTANRRKHDEKMRRFAGAEILYKNGATIEEIAKKYNVSYPTARQYLVDSNTQIRTRRQSLLRAWETRRAQ